MKAYILKTNTTIPPFNDDVSESLFVHETLAEAQDRVLRRLGIEPVRVDSAAQITDRRYLLIYDKVFFSLRIMWSFLRQVRRAEPGTKVLALVKNLSTTQPSALQDTVEEMSPDGDEIFVYDIYFVSGTELPDGSPDEVKRALLEDAERIVTPMREGKIRIRGPAVNPSEGQAQGYIEMPFTGSVVMHINAWVHILWLNQLALGVHWLETIRDHRLWMSGVVFRSFPWRSRARFLGRLVRKGKNCKVHPSAYLEGCILGDNVEVGANATVRFSFVGDGATISDGASLVNSVVGKDAFIREKAFLVACMVYPEATVDAVKMQVSLIGRRALTSLWTALLDAKFEGKIMVETSSGERGAINTPFLGSCVGHDAVLLGKTLLLPGRSIPNGYRVTMGPDEAISDVPKDLPVKTPLIRNARGELVPFRIPGKEG